MKKNLTLLLLCCSFILSAQTTATLMPWGATWKYLNNGSNQGTAWYASTFNDASWSSGAAPLGFGTTDSPVSTVPVTTVGASNNGVTTYYFRSTFTATNLAAYDVVKFNFRVDDGCAIYLNGQLLSGPTTYKSLANSATGTASLSYQLPASWAYNTFASSQNTDGNEVFTYTLAATNTLLVNGTNTIAAEVHNVTASSSDLLWMMQVIGTNTVATLPAIVKGPYLVVGTPTSMVVRWETDVATDTKVMYGTNSNSLTSVISNSSAVTIHTVQLNSLSPYTKYFYNIGSSTLVLQGDTNNYFVTNPMPGTPGKYRFWVVGDCGNASTNQINCRNQYLAYNGNKVTNAMLLSGDNAYNSGTNAEYNAEFFGIYQNDVLKKMTMYSAPGNHDYNNGASTATTVPYFTHFQTPTHGEAGGVPSNNPAYYSFDYGNVHFLSLDSYGTTGASQKMYDTTGAQVTWIKQDLAANNKKWTIAYWHHPPYTMGSHNSDTESDLVSIRSKFIRILERNGVDMIITGHSHDYERSKLMNGHYGNEASFSSATHNLSSSTGLYNGSANSCPYEKDSLNNRTGTVYVLSGSAGQLGGQQSAFPHNAMYYSNATNGGTFILDIEDNKLDAKWLCADGVIRDNFTMVKDVKSKKSFTLQPNQTVTLSASWPGNYVWSNGATTRTLAVSSATSTNVWVKDPNNCVADTFKLKVLPAVSFNATTTPFCTSAPVQFTDLSTNATNAWSWSVSPSSNVTVDNPTSKNPLITFNAAAVYTVSLIASNEHGSGTVFSQAISVIAGQTASAASSANMVCLNQPVALSVSGVNSYTWDSGVSNASIIVTPTATSVYTVTGTDANGCRSIVTKTIVVNPLPVLTVNSIPVNGSVCAGSTLVLTGTGASSFAWSSGVANGVVFTPTGSVSYTLTGTDANGCQATAIKDVSVVPLPVLSVTANPASAIVCAGSPVSLVASGASSYTWSGGVANAVTFTPTASSVFTLNATLNGCENSVTQSVTVNSVPTVTITGANTLCAGQSTTLTSAGANTYSWSTTATSNTISISPVVTTTYVVIGTGTNSCENTVSKIVTVNPLPNVSVVANPTNASVCSGNTISLSGNGANLYAWSGTVTNATAFTPTTNATYTVTGTDINGCQNIAVVSVTVNSNPTLSVAGSSAICSGQSTTFTATGAGTYTWNATSISSTLAAAPVATTIYTLVGANSNACLATITKTLTVNPLPVVSVNNGTICPGYSYTIIPVGASTYTYSGGSNVVSPLVTTQYSVSGTSSLGCVSGAQTTLNVVVANTLTLSVSGPTAVCLGQSTGLTASGATSYTWNTGATGNSLSISPTVNTTYTVTGASPTCSNTKVYSIVVNPLPLVSIAASQTAICVGTNVILTANGTTSYMWNTGTNNASISVNPQSNTSYTLTGYNTNGCAGTATQFIKVNALPTVNALTSAQGLICVGETATLTAMGGTNYMWNNGATSSTLTVSPATTTTYTVKGTDVNGCENLAAVTQSVSECTDLETLMEEGQLKIYPNPNNGVFTVQMGKKGNYTIDIFNVLGELVAKDKITNTSVSINLDGRKGIYVYSIWNEKKRVANGKLIVE